MLHVLRKDYSVPPNTQNPVKKASVHGYTPPSRYTSCTVCAKFRKRPLCAVKKIKYLRMWMATSQNPKMAPQTMLVPSLVGASQHFFTDSRKFLQCANFFTCARKVIRSYLITSFEVATNSFNFTLFSSLHLLNREKKQHFFSEL